MAKKEKKPKPAKKEKKEKKKKEKKQRYMYDTLTSALGGFACLFLLFLLTGIVLIFVFHTAL